MKKNLERPHQAVILAGGRGTRLAPLTDTVPKPMIMFHGKPFLEYLIEMLREQGFTDVLLLLGYLSEVVQDYFGDGKKWGISIRYSVSPVEDDTGRRLKIAEPLLEPRFLLMYCDNYWPMNFQKMWAFYLENPVKAQITIYDNQDRYTKDNVRLSKDGTVLFYDKSRTAPDLKGVDIGFVILEREVLESLPAHENVMFEKVIYPHLIQENQLRAFLSNHRYYSVGSHERLSMTERFLSRRPTVILDRDGVLNKKPPRAQYVRSWQEWQWLPEAKDALRIYHQSGYRTILVSNQAGIGRGAMTEQDLDAIHTRMKSEVIEAGGRIDAIYYCPHDWDEGCVCRKPKPGMLLQAQRDFDLDLSRTLFIGDDERDQQAAEAAGCGSLLVSEKRSLIDFAREYAQPSHVLASYVVAGENK